jgi:predicted amidophosphoribosyltransferase
LGVRCVEVFSTQGDAGEPAEGPARLRQVTERLYVPAVPRLPFSVMLVDDVASSKWTLTQAAVMLQELGVETVVPLVVVGQ